MRHDAIQDFRRKYKTTIWVVGDRIFTENFNSSLDPTFRSWTWVQIKIISDQLGSFLPIWKYFSWPIAWPPILPFSFGEVLTAGYVSQDSYCIPTKVFAHKCKKNWIHQRTFSGLKLIKDKVLKYFYFKLFASFSEDTEYINFYSK